MSDSHENSTVQAELCPLAPSLPFLELHGRGSYGLRRYPFLHNPLDFELEPSNPIPPSWSVELTADSQLIFRCRCQPFAAQTRLLDQPLELGPERWTVIDVRMLPPHRLVSLSAALHYRAWPLTDGQWTIGRPGRRHNSIVLEGASISRAHARIDIAGASVELVPEAEGALTAVNGERLETGRHHELKPNDVLQLGDLLFRWEKEEAISRLAGGRLKLSMLGKPMVALAAAANSDLNFRNENARHLLFWLAACRGASLPVERVLEEFWPERPELRQRKNLSHTLRALQAELGWSEADYDHWIERRAETLALRTDAVESCDLWDLQDAIRLSGKADFDGLLRLHPGPLLPQARQDWVRPLRAEVFLGWLGRVEQSASIETSRAGLGTLLSQCLREGDFEEFIYRQVFQTAANLGLSALIPIWLGELRDHLRAIGDDPSQDLVEQAARLAGQL